VDKAKQATADTDDEADDDVPEEGVALAVPESARMMRFRGKHGLATWNGPWGVVVVPNAAALLLDYLVSKLRTDVVASQLWAEFNAWRSAREGLVAK